MLTLPLPLSHLSPVINYTLKLFDLYRLALACNERLLGTGHPTTLGTVVKIGQLLSDQQLWAESEQMHRRALAGYESFYGSEHEDTVDEVQVSLSLGFEGLCLYTVSILWNMECCIRILWCSSTILYSITSIAHNHHTDVYPLLNT